MNAMKEMIYITLKLITVRNMGMMTLLDYTVISQMIKEFIVNGLLSERKSQTSLSNS